MFTKPRYNLHYECQFSNRTLPEIVTLGATLKYREHNTDVRQAQKTEAKEM